MRQTTPSRLFKTEQPVARFFGLGDWLVLAALVVALYIGVRLAIAAPEIIAGPDISLNPAALPWYALFSVGRMTAAYALSVIFTLIYGRLATINRQAERVLMPLLDVLQSVPILSFLPVVLLSLNAILPERLAAELASIALIFTSQACNLTFSWYQSLTTMPKELKEAAATFRLNSWMRFKTLELPFGLISLVWNSMMSWAGGWFFLMAAEIFTLGNRDFRLPGLGAYLHEAANKGNFQAIAWGLGTLILVVVLLDQVVWRPLLTWSDHFKVEMVENDNPPTSWFYTAFRNSRFAGWLRDGVVNPVTEHLDRAMLSRFPAQDRPEGRQGDRNWIALGISLLFLTGLAYGGFRVFQMLASLPPSAWASIWLAVGASALRVTLALGLALLWTLPVGVGIGGNQRLAALLQPLVQIAASVPATALFPVLLLFLLNLPGGLNIAAVALMLMGTQWYLLFNIIAGTNAIPQDLKYTAMLMHLDRKEHWRTLTLPALFPYLVTGAITASGGAWNATIVAEYVTFSGKTYHTTGIGAMIARATADGDYPLLLAATLAMILTVVLINRLVWRRLYRNAEENYRME